jgi:hypothetical protein
MWGKMLFILFTATEASTLTRYRRDDVTNVRNSLGYHHVTDGSITQIALSVTKTLWSRYKRTVRAKQVVGERWQTLYLVWKGFYHVTELLTHRLQSHAFRCRIKPLLSRKFLILDKIFWEELMTPNFTDDQMKGDEMGRARGIQDT